MKRKVTNKHNLHKAYIAAIKKDNYDTSDGGQKADYSITTLLQPPRIIQMQKMHKVEEDAVDYFERFEGSAIHYLLEQGKEDLTNCIMEKRFYMQYFINNKSYTITAKIDFFDIKKGELVDFKRPTVATAKKGLKEEYKWQINFQSKLLWHYGYKVKDAKIINYVKDWSKMQAHFGRHPESPEIVHQVSLLAGNEVDAFIINRIEMHEAAKAQLPNCTDEERWFNGKDAFRCLLYCPVRNICEMGKKEQLKSNKSKDKLIKVK